MSCTPVSPDTEIRRYGGLFQKSSTNFSLRSLRVNKKSLIFLAEDGSPFLVLIISYISEHVLENILEELSYILETQLRSKAAGEWILNRNRYNALEMMHLLQQLR